MKCNRCGNNPATVKLTRIVKGKVIELNLCQSCAGEVSPFQKKIAAAQSLNALIEQLLKSEKAKGVEEDAAEPIPADLTCPDCGVNFERYKRSLMLGCPRCYEAFGDHLLKDLRKVHGAVQHVGRVPLQYRQRMMLAQRLEQLRQEMQEAISDEDFERAARLRDRIRAVQSEYQSE